MARARSDGYLRKSHQGDPNSSTGKLQNGRVCMRVYHPVAELVRKRRLIQQFLNDVPGQGARTHARTHTCTHTRARVHTPHSLAGQNFLQGEAVREGRRQGEREKKRRRGGREPWVRAMVGRGRVGKERERESAIVSSFCAGTTRGRGERRVGPNCAARAQCRRGGSGGRSVELGAACSLASVAAEDGVARETGGVSR